MTSLPPANGHLPHQLEHWGSGEDHSHTSKGGMAHGQ